MPGKNEHTLTVESAARLLGIGRNQAYEAIHDGRFPVNVIKVGGRYLIPRAELEALLGIERSAGAVSQLRAPARRDEDPGVPSALYVYRNVAGRAIAERGVWKREAVDDDLPPVESKWRLAGEAGWLGIGPMLPSDLPLFRKRAAAVGAV